MMNCRIEDRHLITVWHWGAENAHQDVSSKHSVPSTDTCSCSAGTTKMTALLHDKLGKQTGTCILPEIAPWQAEFLSAWHHPQQAN